MYENVEDLNEKQVNAINMLTSGKTIEEVANSLNLNINTIYRWKRSRSFKRALREQQNQVFDKLTIELSKLGTEAINVLNNIMINASSESLKLKASMFIIDKIIQVEDNETIKRIDEIELKLMEDKNQ